MSSLGEDIVKWAAQRPAWQQEALARLARGESYSTAQIEAIAEALKQGLDPGAEALENEDVPSRGDASDPVNLRAVGRLSDVNALIPDQRLNFGDGGITVIYGHNASGKSGYARLVKSAVGSLHEEEVLGDVFAKGTRPPQKAEIVFSVGGEERSTEWPDDTPRELRAVHFYDQPCGRTYIETDSELDYRPSALSLLDDLIGVCDAVHSVLAEKLRDNDAARAPLPAVAEGTAAARLLTALASQTTPAQLDAASSFDDAAAADLSKLLAEEARLNASDPIKETARLRQTASTMGKLGKHLQEIEVQLGDEAITRATVERDEAVATRAAALAASQKTFDAEPLAGIGSDTWRRMFDAARLYSEHAAYPGQSFPVTAHGSHCPLCQQQLSAEASKRLQNFDSFVKDTTAQRADAAERTLAATITKLEALSVDPPTLADARKALEGRDAELAAQLEALLVAGQKRREATIAALNIQSGPELGALPPSPAKAVNALVAALQADADAINAEEFRKDLAAVATERKELEGRKALTEMRGAMEAEIARLTERDALTAGTAGTDTGGISRKIGDLTDTYVTSEARDRFTRESVDLKLNRIELRRTRTEKGKVHHQPGLIGADAKGKVRDVLSEGEQSALGLAGYFTEAYFDEGRSALVLDDPVTSLDHMRRSAVAERLVKFASERQVIVFTHDLEFVVRLSRAAGRAGVDFTERSVQRLGEGHPGAIFDSLPWKAKDVSQRLHDLGQELARMCKERESLSDEQWEERVAKWAGRLSETWERVLHLELAQPLFDPDEGEVHPTMLKVIAAVTDDDEKEFQAAYRDVSEWLRRHDTDPGSNYVAPECAQLIAALETIKSFHARVRKYKNN
jgi:energy-coupling factor transporter ATP-binding protein EcfA2